MDVCLTGLKKVNAGLIEANTKLNEDCEAISKRAQELDVELLMEKAAAVGHKEALELARKDLAAQEEESAKMKADLQKQLEDQSISHENEKLLLQAERDAARQAQAAAEKRLEEVEAGVEARIAEEIQQTMKAAFERVMEDCRERMPPETKDTLTEIINQFFPEEEGGEEAGADEAEPSTERGADGAEIPADQGAEGAGPSDGGA